MFNGIIHNTGKVRTIRKFKNSILLDIESNLYLKKKDIGSSISCNGVCLTLTKILGKRIYFYVSSETIKRSTFKIIKIGDLINLEKSINFGQEISGHFIQGHVDSVAKIKNINFIDKSWLVKLEIKDKKLSKFLQEKASISINGVSLTISKVQKNYFEVNVIPHTLKLTNLNELKRNSLVNVELDILSKYVYKYSR